ncbi:MAG: 4-hydroxy-3-methylbut-2-enyl diphosphate reductase [Candidatus Omnitrophica bacterium]|nr:4-hydroxy-3-methylbut-2-enyl diphosphate reductase [Candidatus Omnitrophota bacterium]MCM8788625.1 4-hydroxy-3-methylbut-2-enyl diphosphate reductase [Candidatus Omnitrophota bacterium]
MKKIIVGKSVGFCFGVTKAVEMAKEILEKRKSLTTFGDLVHNPLVMEDLKSKGLRVIQKISSARNSPFIIRSHGLAPDLLEKLKSYTQEIYDATCPFVRKVQNLVKKLADENYFIFLVGDPGHPEIRAMQKIAGKNCAIVKSGRAQKNLACAKKKWAIIAQTTLSLDLYRTAIFRILQNIPLEKVTVFNTICPVSIERQQEALSLGRSADALIVVGGRKSSNTKKLVHIGKKVNPNTFLIEFPQEVKKINLAKFEKIGIISGASTDVICIKKVVETLKTIQRKKKLGGKTI